MIHPRLRHCTRAACATALVIGLAGCSMLPNLPFFGAAEKPKPAELPPNAALIAVRPAWTARVGEVKMPLAVNVSGTTVTVAGSDGTVAAIDATTGRDLWRTSVKAPLAAGVGSDGKLAAVVTGANELVALSGGTEAWRQKLGAVAYADRHYSAEEEARVRQELARVEGMSAAGIDAIC